MAIPPAPQSPSADLSGSVLFYSKPEPLSLEAHGKLGLRRMEKPFAFAATTHVVPVTVTEFQAAGVCYPIIFAGERYQPLAVMGVSTGTNLFVEPDGSFQLGAYIPAYIRRYPFVLAADEARSQMVVCIDRNAAMLSEDHDLAFFDDKGQPTEYTKGCMQFCNDFEAEGRRTESFITLLRDLDLFEVRRQTFTPVNPDGAQGEPQPVAEYFAISDEKVKALPADKLKELVENGALFQVYAHLTSLAGWDRIVTMALARQAAEARPANVN
jgi:hypothetical protein